MTEAARFHLAGAQGRPLACYRWSGPEAPRGVVQIAHGRGEHSLRYAAFAAACVKAGLAVVANDHQGHGETTGPGQLGDFGPCGFPGLASDMAVLSREAGRLYPKVALVLLGHSMGSFAAQLYLRDHAHLLSGLVLSDPVCKGRLRWRDSLTGRFLVAFHTVWLSWSLRCGRLRIVRWLVITGRVRR